MLKFDDALTVEGGVVIATGPFDPEKERIIELCAWVYQRDEDDRNDRAATEMTEHREGVHNRLRHKDHDELGSFKGKDDKVHWRLPIGKVGDGNMREGEAFAVAVAMIEDRDKHQQRVIWWGHPVMLKAGPTG